MANWSHQAARRARSPLEVALSLVPTRAGAATGLAWMFTPFAAAYVTAVAVKFETMIDALYWDSDAASAFVLAERLRGDGVVTIPHFGWWTSLWGLLATRALPHHERLWEATGYAFAFAAAAVLGVTVWRVAGGWAGGAAGAAALVVGPDALRSLLTVNFHVAAPFVAVILGAYLVALSRGARSRALAAAVGLFAGASATSDPLVWVSGVAPFLGAVGALAILTRSTRVLRPAGLLLAVSAAAALLTDRLMRALGFEVVSPGIAPAGADDLLPNVLKLAKTIAVLGGANFLYRPTYPSDPLRFVVAGIALVAVAVAVVAAALLARRRADSLRIAYAVFTASTICFLCLAFVSTNQGEAVVGAGGVNYVLALAPATAAAVAVLAAPSTTGRIVVAGAIATLAASNTIRILEEPWRTPARAEHSTELMTLLERSGVTRGYAGYWNAQSLTWQSDMKFLVAPVSQCDLPTSAKLCRFDLFTIDSWFDEREGPSFLIVDPKTDYVTEPKPPPGSAPYAVHRIGKLTIYLFRHDIARNIRA